MKLIDKSALVAEIKIRIETYNKGYANGDDCRADALETFLHDIDALEVKEIGVDIGTFEGDLGRKTVQVIDADGNIKEITFNKAQKGE